MADTPASTSLVPARALPSLAGGAGGLFERLGTLLRQPAVARSLPMLGIVALLGVAALAWAVLHTPAQRTLFSGLDDGDKAAAADALGAAGIPYAIDRDTGALTVADDSFYRAKMLLAQQGLPKSAPDGDAMISALPMGASRAVEDQRLQSAHEMDLARTIEAIDAVETARVHLAASQPSVFLRDDAKPSASVMLTIRSGRALSDAQVQAIVHLVASSVAGLSPDQVSVVDQSGRLLSKSDGADGDGTDHQVDVQNRIEQQYRDGLASLLTPMLGDGNFTTEVHADLDFAETASTSETFPKDGAVVQTEQGTWVASDGTTQPSAGGIPGALSNQPPAAGQISANQNNQAGKAPQNAGPAAPGQPAGQASAAATAKTNESYNRSYELAHQVSVTRAPVGSVRRLSVAVALRDLPGGKKRTPQEIAQIGDLVKGAVGFDQQRGDVVAISSRDFVAADQASPPKWYEASWVSLIGRNLTALLVAGLLVFGIGRPLLKRNAAAAAVHAQERASRRVEIGKQMSGAIAQASRGGSEGRVTLDMIESAPGYAARAELIRNFVKQDPDRAALVVRDLIRSDMPGGDKE